MEEKGFKETYLLAALERTLSLLNPDTHNLQDILDVKGILVENITKLDSGELVYFDQDDENLIIEDPEDYYKTFNNVSELSKNTLEFIRTGLLVQVHPVSQIAGYNRNTDRLVEHIVSQGGDFLFLVSSKSKANNNEEVFVFLRNRISRRNNHTVDDGVKREVMFAQNLTNGTPMFPDSSTFKEMVSRSPTEYSTKVMKVSVKNPAYNETKFMITDYETSLKLIKQNLQTRITRYLWAADDKSWDSHPDIFDKKNGSVAPFQPRILKKGESVKDFMLIPAKSTLGVFERYVPLVHRGTSALSTIRKLFSGEPDYINFTLESLLADCMNSRPRFMDDNNFIDEDLQKINDEFVTILFSKGSSFAAVTDFNKINTPHLIVEYKESASPLQICKVASLLKSLGKDGDDEIYHPISCYRVLDPGKSTMVSEFIYFEKGTDADDTPRAFSLQDNMKTQCFGLPINEQPFNSAICIVLYSKRSINSSSGAAKVIPKTVSSEIAGFKDFFSSTNGQENMNVPRIDPRVLAGISSSELGAEYTKSGNFERDSRVKTLMALPGRYRKDKGKPAFKWFRKSAKFDLSLSNIGFSENISCIDMSDEGTVSGILFYRDRENYKIIKIVQKDRLCYFLVTECRDGVAGATHLDHTIDFDVIFDLLNNSTKTKDQEKIFFGDNGYTSAIVRYGRVEHSRAKNTLSDLTWTSLDYTLMLFMKTVILLTQVVSKYRYVERYIPSARMSAIIVNALFELMIASATVYKLNSQLMYLLETKERDARVQKEAMLAMPYTLDNERVKEREINAYFTYKLANVTNPATNTTSEMNIPSYTLAVNETGDPFVETSTYYFDVTNELTNPLTKLSTSTTFTPFKTMSEPLKAALFGNFSSLTTETREQAINREILFVLEPETASNVFPEGFSYEISARRQRETLEDEYKLKHTHDPTKTQTEMLSDVYTILLEVKDDKRVYDNLWSRTSELEKVILRGIDSKDTKYMQTGHTGNFSSVVDEFWKINTKNKHLGKQTNSFRVKEAIKYQIEYLKKLQTIQDNLLVVNPRFHFSVLYDQHEFLKNHGETLKTESKDLETTIKRLGHDVRIVSEQQKASLKEFQDNANAIKTKIGNLEKSLNNPQELKQISECHRKSNETVLDKNSISVDLSECSRIIAKRCINLKEKEIETGALIEVQNNTILFYNTRQTEIKSIIEGNKACSERIDAIIKKIKEYREDIDKVYKIWSPQVPKINTLYYRSATLQGNSTSGHGNSTNGQGNSTSGQFTTPHLEKFSPSASESYIYDLEKVYDIPRTEMITQKIKELEHKLGKQSNDLIGYKYNVYTNKSPEEIRVEYEKFEKVAQAEQTTISEIHELTMELEFSKRVFRNDVAGFMPLDVANYTDLGSQQFLGNLFGAELERYTNWLEKSDQPSKKHHGVFSSPIVHNTQYHELTNISSVNMEHIFNCSVESYGNLYVEREKKIAEYNRLKTVCDLNPTDKDACKKVDVLVDNIDSLTKGMETLQEKVLGPASNTREFIFSVEGKKDRVTHIVALLDPKVIHDSQEKIAQKIGNNNTDFIKGKPIPLWNSITKDRTIIYQGDAKDFFLWTTDSTNKLVKCAFYKEISVRLSTFAKTVDKKSNNANLILDVTRGVRNNLCKSTFFSKVVYVRKTNRLFFTFSNKSEMDNFVKDVSKSELLSQHEPWKKLLDFTLNKIN